MELENNQQSNAHRMIRSSGTTVVRFVSSIIDAGASIATFLLTWIANLLTISYLARMPPSTKAAYELVPRTEEGSFTLREFRLPAFQSPWHFHPEWELTCILIETNEDVGRIACASGFASLSNFNRLFRQRQQMAPKAYRQLHRESDGYCD